MFSYFNSSPSLKGRGFLEEQIKDSPFTPCFKKLDFIYQSSYYHSVATEVNKFLKENKILSTYTAVLAVTLLFLWIISYFNIAYPLTITQRNASGELAVVGVGKVDIVPDTAWVDLGIVATNAQTVADAQNQINKANNAIVDGVKQLGIGKEDIKTSNYSITPNYDYSKGGNGTISGYNGNATVTVRVKQTDKLPQVIEAGTKAGANQVIGTNYYVDKPENYQEQARDKAIANAKEQAQKLANSLGIRLGKAVNIVEATSNEPISMMLRSQAVGLGGGSTPANLQPGTQTITSTVTLYF
jgi:hypothetical protein